MSGDGRIERGELAFERDFLQMPNAWARGKVKDSDQEVVLSLRAIGLLAQMLSHKPGFVVTFKTLARLNHEGDAALRTAVNELKEAGFLEIEKLRNRRGTITGSIWRLTDPAEVERRKRGQPALPGLAQPGVDKPHVDNQHLKEAHPEEDSYPGVSSDPSTPAGEESVALTGADPLDAIWEVCPVTRGDHLFDSDHGWCTTCAQANVDGSVRDLNGKTLRAAQTTSASS